jgi:hypothetical protein
MTQIELKDYLIWLLRRVVPKPRSVVPGIKNAWHVAWQMVCEFNDSLHSVYRNSPVIGLLLSIMGGTLAMLIWLLIFVLSSSEPGPIKTLPDSAGWVLIGVALVTAIPHLWWAGLAKFRDERAQMLQQLTRNRHEHD